MRYVPLAVLLVVALLLAACGEADDNDNGGNGSGGPTATSTSGNTASPTAGGSPTNEPVGTTTPDAIEHPMGADELVLRVHTGGGFVPIEFLFTDLPEFSLYGNGTLITEGPLIEIFPPPALPNLQVTKISEEGIQTILRAAREAGLLDGDQQYIDAPVADAPTTTFTTNAGGQTSVVSAYALTIDMPNAPENPDAEARAKLLDFTEQIGDVTTLLAPNDIVADATAYDFDRLQLIFNLATADLEQPEMEWPLATPLAELGVPYSVEGTRCAVIEGDDLATLLPVLREANSQTPWSSGEELYVLFPRPLLPDETGCPDSGEPVPPTSTPGTGGTIEHPTGADEVVLRIDVTNGFVMPSTLVTTLPTFVVYGDGSVVFGGPQIAIYPPPALPNLQVAHMTEEQLQTLLAEAEAAGLLDGDQNWTTMMVADVATTYFYVNAGGSVTRVSAYALEFPPDPASGMPADEIEAREKLQAFQESAMLLLGSLQMQPTTPFEIERLQLVIEPIDPSVPPADDLGSQELDWPLATPPAEIGTEYSLATNSRCVVLEGDDLATMLAALAGANQLTRWNAGEEQFFAYPRPVLPGETGCAEPFQTPPF
jgi:hypothetical protein